MINKFEIFPFVGVGCIEFDSTRDDNRKKLGKYTEFRKSRFSKNTTDNYGDFHIYYSVDNKVDAIEFFHGAHVLFKDSNIFNLNKEELISLFNDKKMVIEDDTINFESFGVEVVL